MKNTHESAEAFLRSNVEPPYERLNFRQIADLMFAYAESLEPQKKPKRPWKQVSSQDPDKGLRDTISKSLFNQ